MVKVLNIAWMAAVLMLAISVGMILTAFGLTALDRTPPIEIASYEILTPKVSRGGVFEGVWHVRINRSCPGDASRSIVSVTDDGWWEPVGSIHYDLGANLSVFPTEIRLPITPIVIPHDAPVGKMEYHNRSSFYCNTLGHLFFPIIINLPILAFDVTDGGENVVP